MRVIAGLLLLVAAAPADEADDYFEIGLAYLKTGFYADARAAFAESLVRAPSEAVPTAFAAVACAGEGRDSASCAYLLRLAYRRLPAKTALRLDLRERLRHERDLRAIERRFQARLPGAKGGVRRDHLTVLAFLQAQDGTPASSPALDALLEEHPDDAFGQALSRLRPKAEDPPAGPKPPEKPKAEDAEPKKPSS